MENLEALSARDIREQAEALRDIGFGSVMSYSPKVFIPLTVLCRNACAYCTFAKPPSRTDKLFLEPDDVLRIARAGQASGCLEALFTLGDKPEMRYGAARRWLESRGYASTAMYLVAMARLVLEETGLFPHINAGVLDASEMGALREVSFSQGLMLESLSERLCQRGGPHFGAPDKRPAARLNVLSTAGELDIPFTTGLLIGIGETRRERLDALLAIRDLQARYGHIQEVIIQNFRAKPGTKMANAREPDIEEILWTTSAARIILGPDMSIQVPPNLNETNLSALIEAGINDWGGISPVTPDHVNPEKAWPHISDLAAQTARRGKTLVPRLTVYPKYAQAADKWIDTRLRRALRARMDSEGFARADQWSPGAAIDIQSGSGMRRTPPPNTASGLDQLVSRAIGGAALGEQDIVRLFAARDGGFDLVCAAADELRRAINGETVTYVVTRNINYTNICSYHCTFCAFSKGKVADHLRGRPYVLQLDEIARRASEAWDRGATEVCLQGGIHPSYTGATYLDICRAIKSAVPKIHIHAFSPLEIRHGAESLDLSPAAFLQRLIAVGLASLPGTAAEILDDEVRREICPDKLTTDEWLSIVEAAHRAGLRTTATIMFGHLERPVHWARHLLRLRRLQERTGGFTEFVPLPFVPMEAPIFVRDGCRRGPTSREALLMHAVSRLVLNPLFDNIQTSWAKMGRKGAVASLNAGCNDMGGTLMNESISRAAGASHGQEITPSEMDALISGAGRIPLQRTTLYERAVSDRVSAAYRAAPLMAV